MTDEIRYQQSQAPSDSFTVRDRLYNFLNGVYFQVFMMGVVCTDIGILLGHTGGDEGEDGSVIAVTMIILVIFLVEVLLKGAIYGPYLFVKDPFNLFDSVVVLLSFICTFAEATNVGLGVATLRTTRNVYKAVKVLRTVRSLRYLYKSLQGTSTGARKLVGRNKQRYVDLVNQFDLDLCYIDDKKRLIVMSVPAVGRLALFRNPIWEVVRFFETKHKNSYRIYNCCPEHPYPDKDFGAAIIKYNVQDHSPPTMESFVSFMNDAGKYIGSGEDGKTIAVHCRGGKGRSGSLCCAWLLYSKECATADKALAKFALSRTESRMVGSLQGVETPSQKRYIYQVEQLLLKQNLYWGDGPLSLPKAKKMRLKSLHLDMLFSDPAGMAKLGPIVCTVSVEGEMVFTSEPVLHEVLSNKVTFRLNDTEVSGDVQVSVYIKDRMKVEKVAKSGKEKGILFTFFFHSAFTSKGELSMKTKMIDKAVKNKKIKGTSMKKPYRMDGGLRLLFD
ncbi:hypothetical protein TrRE_jg9251 [Triparma retinervis]|uniref:Phosphatidylinositol-3,4,5-trisphosphate 3-phosphatase n=1 Tax=Triparma retinervis TaxID=2557542 RepID=A0A9W7A7B9_9STRA|nr:hypothetical protein TrRE_jg9251 [Triparma retinervis]